MATSSISETAEAQLMKHLQSKRWRMNSLYYVVNERGEKVPFRMNMIQERIYQEQSGYRDLILKYRQGGVSTYKIIDLVDDTIFGGKNHSNYFVTHRQDLLDEFFKKAKFTFDTINEIVRPFIEKPKLSNANELFFEETNNTLRIGLDVRGRTPTNLHISEFGPMGMEKQTALFQQFDSFRETKITIESTANGMGDVFHRMCMNAQEGLGDFKLLFYGFDIDDRNERDAPAFIPTDDEMQFMNNHLAQYPYDKAIRKMAWRRTRIETANALGDDGRRKFSEENPITIEDAFISSGAAVFDMSLQYEIEKPIEEVEGFKVYSEPEDQLSIGIDIAEGGVTGDYSTISARRKNGRLAFQYKGKVSEEILAQKVDFILTQYIKNDRKFLGGILPENNVGLAFINECKKYPWFQYVMKERRDNLASEENLVQKYGFRTTLQSKDMLIREYRGALCRKEITISGELHKEMSSFLYDKNNRPNAIAPNHDDLLMADMIAYYGIKHEPFVATYQKPVVDEEGLSVMELFHLKLRRGDYNQEEEYGYY